MRNLALASIFAIAMGFAFVLSPYVYSHHFFSLAKLRNSIAIGEEYEVVREKFEGYESKYGARREQRVTFSKMRLFISDVNIFDTCRLTVNFDHNGLVDEIVYVAD